MKNQIDLEINQREIFQLGDDTHVWQLSLQISKEKQDYFQSFLTEDEIKRALRFHFDNHRNHFIAARGQIRFILGKYLKIQPDRLEFEYNTYGKPAVKGNTVFFNLSHSHHLALLAIHAKNDLGIDIEWKGRKINYLEIGQRFFSENEYRELASLSPELQGDGFFNCWTRKEAYIKALGEGLHIPLAQFEVSLIPGEPTMLRSTNHNPQAINTWKLMEVTINPDYAAALAIKKNADHYSLFKTADLLQK